MTYRSAAGGGLSPVKALVTSITNLDKRLRIIEKQEVGTSDSTPIPGEGDLNYVHTQSAPSATWTINHNLNKFPAIDVVDTGGSVVIPDVRYDSSNQATITFGSPTSGRAYCN